MSATNAKNSSLRAGAPSVSSCLREASWAGEADRGALLHRRSSQAGQAGLMHQALLH
jgi:hypothetical protein